MSPLTHPAEVNPLILEHLRSGGTLADPAHAALRELDSPPLRALFRNAFF
jgi:hypothetical protein